MRSSILPAAALLVAAAGAAHTQPPPRPTPELVAPVPTTPQVAPRAAVPELPLTDRSVDQLLDRLEALRAQKAELEKQEQEVVKELRRKLEKQADRATRLGVTPAGPAPGPLPTVQPQRIP